MSRTVNSTGSYEGWVRRVDRALYSRKGQQRLQKLAQALLALPEPVLIAEKLSDGQNVCALGALAAVTMEQRGMPRERALQSLQDDDPWDVGMDIGLSETFVTVLMHRNDDWNAGSPRQRYIGMLSWIKELLEIGQSYS